MSNLTTKENAWHHQIVSALAELNLGSHFFLLDHFSLLFINKHQLIIHLVNVNNHFKPAELIALQLNYSSEGIKLIHLWEDVWFAKPRQALARIMSLLGLNKKIHGRKTKIHKLDKVATETFLNENHLQAYVSCRYKLGLFENDDLIAVATFSALRKMSHSIDYKSAELIRFAVKSGYSVSGGLSKLLMYFFKQYKPNDIMTYADRDWSAGESYLTLGFDKTAVLAPHYFSLNEEKERSVVKAHQPMQINVFNTGSLKFILKNKND
ncbi:hypothetical protein OQZ29_12285 [Pedobacter agri]|uniref:Uncharacterized protein n=2 Tax=Pedobacter agri TaxID=454586 RepID=A0A9X3DG60_9SPHI|nr:hypothetical protein [Pedobacter agri]MCX3265530.1 hypothetical protein [Pedobacter agri]